MGKMRKKDRERDREFALSVVDRCDYAVLAMTDIDNNPYCVPISIVMDSGSIYFHCAKEGMKTDCLRHNPNVCITCVTDTFKPDYYFTTTFKSAIIKAVATEITDTAEMLRILNLLCLRHNPGNMAKFDAEIEKMDDFELLECLSEVSGMKIPKSLDDLKGKEKRFNGVCDKTELLKTVSEFIGK